MKSAQLSTCFIVIAILTCWHIAYAQPLPLRTNQKSIDSLIRILPSLPQDTNRVMNLHQLARMTTMNNAIQAAKYAQEGYTLAQKLDFKKGEILCMQAQVWFSMGTSDWVKGTELCYKGINLSEKYQPAEALFFYCMMGLMLEHQNEITKSLEWILKSKNHPLFAKASVEKVQWITLLRISSLYAKLNQLDSAFYYAQKSYHLGMKHSMGGHPAWSLTTMGTVEGKRRHYTEAIDYLQQAILLFKQNEYQYPVHDTQYEIAEVYNKMNLSDSAIHYATLAFEGAKTFASEKLLLRKKASELLATIFENINIEKAYDYLKISNETEEILLNADKIKQLEQVEYKEQQRLTDLQSAEIAYNNKIRQNTLLGISGTFVLLALLLWRNNQAKQKTNTLLQAQKEEIRQTLKELKSTQTQLIQKEKLASLGELTAGIAHEIQNPLNFVNNLSEVNRELLIEMKGEFEKGNHAEVKEITSNLIENEEKITYHGKRADAIVKGMLEHSKRGTGKKEITDLNALAEEITKLSYNSFLNKNQKFKCDYRFDLDPKLPKIELIPQDIGKALLNLLNNAFYACGNQPSEGEKPTVIVSTINLGDKIQISVTDNGPGIPDSIKDKIFQPFFTTKPTGVGTGLGLSLSYDIVKVHGGELKVETEEGKGSEFIIHLPIGS